MLVFQTCAVLGLAREGANECPDNGKGELAGRLVDSKGPGSDRTFLLNRLLVYRNTRSYRGLNRGRQVNVCYPRGISPPKADGSPAVSCERL
jgi:hypothetical protein